MSIDPGKVGAGALMKRRKRNTHHDFLVSPKNKSEFVPKSEMALAAYEISTVPEAITAIDHQGL